MLQVPARAEIVLEGHIPCRRLSGVSERGIR